MLSGVLAAPVVVPAGTAARMSLPYRILPGPFTKNAPVEADPPTASRFTLHGVTVQIDLPDKAQRAAFVRSIDPKGIDPFAEPDGRPERYRTFLVTFANDSPEDVTFQPGNVVLKPDHGDPMFPVDTADLYLAEERLGSADPQRAVDRVAPFIFDSSTQIRRGARLARMLVFGPLPERWKQFELHFSFLQIGTETHTLSFIFHKQILKG